MNKSGRDKKRAATEIRGSSQAVTFWLDWNAAGDAIRMARGNYATDCNTTQVASVIIVYLPSPTCMVKERATFLHVRHAHCRKQGKCALFSAATYPIHGIKKKCPRNGSLHISPLGGRQLSLSTGKIS